MKSEAEKIVRTLSRIQAIAESCEYYAECCRAENAVHESLYLEGKAHVFEMMAQSLREAMEGKSPLAITPGVARIYETM